MGAVVLTNDQRGVGIQTAIGTLMNKGIPLDAVEAGTPYVVSLGLEERIPYWFWAKGMKEVECRNASIEKI